MTWAEQWAETLLQSARAMGTRLGGFIPNLAGMLLILLVGYFVSRILARVGAALLARLGFDRAAASIGFTRLMSRAGIDVEASKMVGRLVFWFSMLTFLVSAAEALGLANVSDTIDSFVAYLPNVFAAVFIAVGGVLLANWLKEQIAQASASIGLDYANALATVVYVGIVVLAASMAIGQLKIEMTLINRVIQIVLIAAGAGLALTLGLGTRDIARHLVAGTYARDMFAPGMEISVGDHVGTLEEVGTVAARIRRPGGDVAFIPNGMLMEGVVTGREPGVP
jgi:small-conductance mechanosensitive channel